jgi:endoglucanase
MTRLFFLWTIGIAIVGLTFLTKPSFADAQHWYTGVNMAGAEFASKKIPGVLNKDYVYPKEEDIDYFISKGLTTFRFPFRWERLQPTLGGVFEPNELAQIDKVVNYVTSKKARIILDPHNYGARRSPDGTKDLIGSTEVPTRDFITFWEKLAERYKNNPHVIFGLMNEPVKQSGAEWRRIMDAVVDAIRTTGAKNLILVPGTGWDGAHSWLRINGLAFETFVDPANNFAFEVHQYLDSDSSGRSDTCVSETIGVERLKKFTQWLREHGHRGFLGEFGIADNSVCMKALDNMLQNISENSDVWVGWTYWAAGRWWGSYKYSVHPKNGVDKPQLAVLKKHVGTAVANPVPTPDQEPTTTTSTEPTTTTSTEPTTTTSTEPTSTEPTTTTSTEPTTVTITTSKDSLKCRKSPNGVWYCWR